MSKMSASAMREEEERVRREMANERAVAEEKKRQEEAARKKVLHDKMLAEASSCWCGVLHEQNRFMTEPRGAAKFEPANPESSSLFISNITYDLDRKTVAQTLTGMVSPHRVLRCQVFQLPDSQEWEHRGLAIMTFESVEQARKAALFLSGHLLFRKGMRLPLKVDFNKAKARS